ncbi:hypothetical protein L6452_37929 [Arctium lappa]|uniref:Uncharacterized protein n=1 Tax=Arctium lappa TaxID=4217 RepID=A0ACB8Y8G8_ARCLA|nr:hypothetical protein L6452_37929 [Arctium lappa]
MAMESNKPPSVYLTNLDEVKQVFSRFNVNGDGKISAVELVDVMKALGSDTSLDEVNRIMADIDNDCDGVISLEEIAGFCKGKSGEEDDNGGMKELQDAFELYDLNKNGLKLEIVNYLVSNNMILKLEEEICLICGKPYINNQILIRYMIG